MNEDARLERPDIGLWVVADGMGGHAAGDVASAMIIEALDELRAPARLSELVDQVEARLQDVNARLRDIALREDTPTIGSTVVSLILNGHHGVCMWAGDSRVYRYRGQRLEQISQDHALVEELVEKGLLTREQAARHPQGNLVTRAVGASDELVVDLEIVHLEPGDVFVLCSDGLDKEVEPEEIAEVLCDEGATASHALVDLALSRHSRDNVTVVTVEVSANAESCDELLERDEDKDTAPGAGGGAA